MVGAQPDSEFRVILEDVAEQVVEDVTDLIECFEDITTKHSMEKIKTIGDEYMATAGLLLENDEPGQWLENVFRSA